MKALTVNGREFNADKIIKNTESVIGKDSLGNELFAFKGISDFSGFILEEGQEFDVEENLIDKLILDNLNMQTQLDSLITSGLGGN